MSASKNRRSGNFAPAEVESLITLLQKHKTGILCQKTDAKNEISKITWDRIASEFNMNADVYRSAATLKGKYKNMKSTSAKKYSELKTYQRGTGGGPAKSTAITSVDEVIKDIHSGQIEGMPSQFDGDCDEDELGQEFADVNVEDMDVENIRIEFIHTDEEAEIGKDESMVHESDAARANVTEVTNKWDKYNPDKLKKLPSTPLRATGTCTDSKKTREPIHTKLGSWAQTKVELADLQKPTFMEQQEEKMKHLRAKNLLELELMEKESLERRKWAKTEHTLKLDILKLQKRYE